MVKNWIFLSVCLLIGLFLLAVYSRFGEPSDVRGDHAAQVLHWERVESQEDRASVQIYQAALPVDGASSSAPLLILVEGLHQDIQIDCNGIRIADFPQEGNGRDHSGIFLAALPLPSEEGEYGLTLYVSSPFPGYDSTLPLVRIGTRTALLRQLFKSFLIQVSLCLLFVVSGLLFLVRNVAQGYRPRGEWFSASARNRLLLPAFSILWGFYSFFSIPYPCVGAYLLNPRTLSTISFLLFYWTPLPAICYLAGLPKRYHRPAALFPLCFLIFSCTATVVWAADLLPLPMLLFPFNLLSCVSLFFLLLLVGSDIREKTGKAYLIDLLIVGVPLAAISIDLSLFYSKSHYPPPLGSSDAFSSLVLLSLILWRLYSQAHREMEYQSDLKILRVKNDLILTSYEELCTQSQAIRAFRHTSQNHILALISLLENKESEKALHYLKHLDRENRSASGDSRIVFCGDFLLDRILNHKLGDLPGRGIRLDYDVRIPADLPMEEADLCTLLVNVLDNAREAVLAAADAGTEGCFVLLALRYQAKCLFFRCENTKCNPVHKKNDHFLSHKAHPEEHGLGLRIVDTLVRKYHGTLDISYSETDFRLHLLLDLNQPPADRRD